jgi:hypothetical protein
VKALRLSFTKKTGLGFYLRAESFFNVASHVDSLGASHSYGGKSLHDQSHGESFISLLQNRFTRSGFYLMDEPETALSPQRQLSFLVLLHELVADNDNIQFLIATHSPILLALLASASAFPSSSANLSALRVSALSFSVRRAATTAAERHAEQSPSNLPKNQLTLRTTGMLACRSTCVTSVSLNREASYSNERCFLSSSTRNFRNP